MTNRERMLAIMAGQSPDRIPWIPRPDVWYEARRRSGTLPEKFQDMSLREIRSALRMGTWRMAPICSTKIRDTDIRTHQRGDEIVTDYITPVGTVSTRYRQSPRLASLGMAGQEVEKMVKGPEDYAVAEYIVRQTEIVPNYEEYLAVEGEMGETGYPMVFSAMDPLSELMLSLVGYNDVYYHLQDYPTEVARLLEALEERARRIQRIVLESPARLVMSGTHFSAMMTPPRLYKKMMPFYQSFADELHQRGKLQVCHADADTNLLLELLMESGFDVMDSFVTAPMVDVTLQQARKVFGSRVIIWGGLPSTMLCDPITDEEFEHYMMKLFRTIAPGDAFILAVADNIMMESKIERLEWVADALEKYGNYPIEVPL